MFYFKLYFSFAWILLVYLAICQPVLSVDPIYYHKAWHEGNSRGSRLNICCLYMSPGSGAPFRSAWGICRKLWTIDNSLLERGGNRLAQK